MINLYKITFHFYLLIQQPSDKSDEAKRQFLL